MKYPKDLTDIRFNRLIVIKQVEKPKHLKRTESYWLCKCECGNEIIAGRNRLVTNHTNSCGCFQKERISEIRTSHKMSNTRFYIIWANMIQRCENSNNQSYEYYGYRGIEVCKEWLVFENFMSDMYKSYIEHVEKNGEKDTTLDRTDVNQNYDSLNCRWSTIKEQANNKRNNITVEINGEGFKSLSELSDRYYINEETLRCRYHSGKREEELIKRK